MVEYSLKGANKFKYLGQSYVISFGAKERACSFTFSPSEFEYRQSTTYIRQCAKRPVPSLIQHLSHHRKTLSTLLLIAIDSIDLSSTLRNESENSR
jgi:hypothetical protein